MKFLLFLLLIFIFVACDGSKNKSCMENEHLENELCVKNQKTVFCVSDNDKPEHSADIKQEVTINWNENWEEIPVCEWECNTGYHKKDNDCIRDEECLENTCSKHGDCLIKDYKVSCDCNEGYSGENCESCMNGYQDNDNNGTCEKTCLIANLNCGSDSHCEDLTGVATCKCDENFHFEDSICLANTKEIDCQLNNKDNAHDIIEKVQINWTEASGWGEPELCEFECNEHYYKVDNDCIGDEEIPYWSEINLKAEKIDDYSLILTWDEALDNIGIAKYKIYQNDVEIAETADTEYQIEDLKALKEYCFSIEAFDYENNSSGKTGNTCIHFDDVTAPLFEGEIEVLQLGSAGFKLKWNKATDNIGVENYKIYQNDDFIKETTLNYITIKNLNADTSYEIKVVAVDKSENESIPLLKEIITLPEETVNLIVPERDEKITGTFFDNYSFLFDGITPVQFGYEEGVFEAEKLSVITGIVKDNDGNAIEHVKISVLNHDEYGYTFTRENGEFDFAVNGNGKFNIKYEKEGLISVQRRVQTTWNDFFHANDVVMIPYDENVTEINLETQTEIEIVAGTEITDSDGTRTNRLLIKPGTVATAVYEDGTTEELNNIHVRATEFTVGENGADRMPADLPNTTAYTYAVSFTIDEAEENGAKEVKFNKPVYDYVDNFLNFPVGIIIPTGYFDEEKGIWVASDDGFVLKIIDIIDGKAQIDITGDDIPEEMDVLERFSIDEYELIKLAEIFEAGKELWRVPILHFSDWDHNQPGACAEGACTKPEKQKIKKVPCDKEKSGSVIGVQNRTLGERLGIPGTPFYLNYNSKFEKAYKEGRSIKIPLRGDETPDGIIATHVIVRIAGKKHHVRLSGVPRNYTFVWNGKDKYGREVYGAFDADIKVGYEYKAVFGTRAIEVSTGKRRGRSFALMMFRNVYLTINFGRKNVILWTDYGSVKLYNYKVPNNWSINVKHSYDPKNGVVFKGSGKIVNPETVSKFKAMYKLENGTSNIKFNKDGKLYFVNGGKLRKTDIKTGGTEDVLTGFSYNTKYKIDENGDIYYIESNQIKKYDVKTNETVIIAGTGDRYYTGINRDKKYALLNGSRMFYDRFHNRLWIAESSVGQGLLYVDENNILRKSDLIPEISGNDVIRGITQDSEGNLYFLMQTRLIKVDTDFNVTYLVNNDYNGGINCEKEEGVNQINDMCIGGALDIDIDENDNLYILDYYNNSDYSCYNGSTRARIRKVTANGEVTTITGNKCNPVYDANIDMDIENLLMQSRVLKYHDNKLYISQRESIIAFDLNTKKISEIIGGGWAGRNPVENQSYEGQSFGAKTKSINFDSEGSLYYFNDYQNIIYKIDNDKIITRVAGNGDYGFSGDGGLAIDAKIYEGTSASDVGIGLVFLPNNKLLFFNALSGGYHTDTYSRVIREVDLNTGIINNYAGQYDFRFQGDGFKADDLQISPIDIALDNRGGLYFINNLSYGWPSKRFDTLRYISPDGYIYNISGLGDDLHGDNISAKDKSFIGINNLNVSKQGNIYFSGFESYGSGDFIYKIDGSGKITKIAGGGERFLSSGECGKDIKIGNTSLLRIDENENVFFIQDYIRSLWKLSGDRIYSVAGYCDANTEDELNDCVYKDNDKKKGNAHYTRVENNYLAVFNGLPYIIKNYNSDYRLVEIGGAEFVDKFKIGDSFVASKDGSLLYHFSQNGLHLETYSSVTHKIIYKFDYNEDNTLRSITDIDGKVTNFKYLDGNLSQIESPYGEITNFEVNDSGNIVKMTIPSGKSWEMTYDNGLLKTFRKPNGATSSFYYDEIGKLVRDSNAIGAHKLLSESDIDNGKQVIFQSPLGRQEIYKTIFYNNNSIEFRNSDYAGRFTTSKKSGNGDITVSYPNGMSSFISFKSDNRFGSKYVGKSITRFPSGREISVRNDKSFTFIDDDIYDIETITTTTTLNNSQAVSSVYNRAENKITTTSQMGRTRISYFDEKGRIIKVSRAGISDVNYEYDADGRLSKITQGEGANARFVEFDYNEKSRLESMTDNAGRVKFFDYNEDGQLIKSTAPNGQITEYSYDENGNRTAVKLKSDNSKTHEFTYDLIDRAISYISPLDNEVTSTYNDDNQLTESTEPVSRTFVNHYNNATGELFRVSYPGGELNYDFDDETGNLTSVTRSDGASVSFEYDGSLLVSETVQNGQMQTETSYDYDDFLRLNKLTVNGFDVNYGYNEDNQVTSVNEMSYNYDENGFLYQSSIEDIIETYTYNNFGERSRVTVSQNDTTLYQNDYLYDNLGRINQITSTLREPQGSDVTGVKHYEYDLIGRLVKVTNGNNEVLEEYSYDDNGNRVSAKGGITAVYDSEDKLLSYGDNSYTYTERGTLLSKTTPEGTTTYTYDAFNNLTKVVLPDGKVIEYEIDIHDRRVAKKVNGVVIKRYVYEDGLNISQEVDEEGNILVQYVYGIKRNVPEFMVKDGIKYKIISDHLGSPIEVRATTGQAQDLPVLSRKYDSFGNIIERSGDLELPFGFAGGIWDEDTKLIRFGVRDYDPETGRWTSKEPLGFAGSRNWYSYCDDDPVNYWDLDGYYFNFASNYITEKEFKEMVSDIASINPELKIMILTLERSKKEILIIDEDSNNDFCSELQINDTGSEGVTLNFSNNPDFKDGVDMGPLEILAHELKHAYDSITRNSSYPSKRESEREAVRIQNYIREKLGKKPRTKYGNWNFKF